MFHRHSIRIVLGLAVALVLPLQASASEQMRDLLRQLAKDILAYTKDQPVSIGQINPTGLPHANAGPCLEGTLRFELETLHKGIVQASAQYKVEGEYALVASERYPGMKEIKIVVRLIDTSTGNDLTRLQCRLDGTSTIAELTQVTAALPPNGTKEERNRLLQKILEHPSVFIHGRENTLVSSRQESPYALEILVKPMENSRKQQGTPCTVHVEEGHAFVDIHKDQVYEVALHNKSDTPVLAGVFIDGLDVFNFSKDRNRSGRPRYGHFLVKPNSTTKISGWYQTGSGADDSLSFSTTEYGQGTGSTLRLAGRGPVGVIHVQFSRGNEIKPGAMPRGYEFTDTPPGKAGQKPIRYQLEPLHDYVSVRYHR